MLKILDAVKYFCHPSVITLLFPGSWNAYDSYAETLAITGKKEEAIAMYKKSLAINPNNRGGKNALQQLEGR